MPEKKQILLIDDAEEFRNLLKKGLELVGNFEVSIAANGQEGIRMARRQMPHLILLDICMPGINGLEVLKKLKEDEHTLEIPVIMLTAIIETIKEERARLYDEFYLEKPVELSVLKTKIEEVLNRRGSE